MKAQDYLAFSATKEVKYLYKSFIESLEEIARQHDSAMFKLMENLPEEHKGKIIQASFFDEEAYQHFRKLALDHGNDCARAILDEIQKYEIDFKR
jgi:hypothetical protein